MTVRRATGADAGVLADLNRHVQEWHAAHYPKVFHARPDRQGVLDWFVDRLSDPACSAFLAGDPAQGYALCSLQARAANVFSPPVRRLMIDHVAVAPSTRRQGLGRALLQAARALARELAADEVLLDTWEANRDAHAFFRAEGFQPRRMLFHAAP
jgi:ribosomal protein S18 acetylase RimI-like enzyme